MTWLLPASQPWPSPYTVPRPQLLLTTCSADCLSHAFSGPSSFLWTLCFAMNIFVHLHLTGAFCRPMSGVQSSRQICECFLLCLAHQDSIEHREWGGGLLGSGDALLCALLGRAGAEEQAVRRTCLLPAMVTTLAVLGPITK